MSRPHGLRRTTWHSTTSSSNPPRTAQAALRDRCHQRAIGWTHRCCDVFELTGGKIKRFDCYPAGSIILTQLGVIGDLSAAL